jgi:hypothetical protein
MRLLKYLALLALADSGMTSAEPRGVRLRVELADAQTIARVRITSYDQGQVKWTMVNPTNGPDSARCSTDPTWTPAPSPRPSDGIHTARWPMVGEEVLVVVGKDGVVSLFAELKGDKWRFWSPEMTGSVASFECESPATDLPGQKPGLIKHSWDGCLMPKAAVTLRAGSQKENAGH